MRPPNHVIVDAVAGSEPLTVYSEVGGEHPEARHGNNAAAVPKQRKAGLPPVLQPKHAAPQICGPGVPGLGGRAQQGARLNPAGHEGVPRTLLRARRDEDRHKASRHPEELRREARGAHCLGRRSRHIGVQTPPGILLRPDHAKEDNRYDFHHEAFRTSINDAELR